MEKSVKRWRVLRLAVPDFDKLIRLYEQTNDINKILTTFWSNEYKF